MADPKKPPTEADPERPAKPRGNAGAGTIYYDTSRGRYVGQAWIDGKRRKVSAKTKKDATKKLGALVHGDEAERHADRRLTVTRLLADWQATALPGRNIAPATAESHAWACALWTKELGKAKLHLLDAPTVEAALLRMSKNGLAKASLLKAKATLRLAIKWAERRRLVAHNAAAIAELPPSAKPPRTRRALSTDELGRVLDALADHPLYALFLTMARVGLRPGEAAALCTDVLDLDGDPPTLSVVRGLQRQQGRPVLVDELKTTGSVRTLAIPPDVVTALRAVVAKAPTEGDGPHLLFAAANGAPLWATTMRAELAAACAAAEVPVVVPHELRHTAATHLAERLPPHRVADVLGHASTRMIDEIYRHRPDIIRGAEG